MSLSYRWSDHDSSRKYRFLCLPKPARSFSLLDIHVTRVTFRAGAAVTAITAALPSSQATKSTKRKLGRLVILNKPHCVPFVLFCG